MKRTATTAWNIVDAKGHLSEVVRAARETGEPQRIAKRGRVVAVVLDNDRFEALRSAADRGRPEAGWQAFLAASAAVRDAGGVTLPLPRRRSRRATKLGG